MMTCDEFRSRVLEADSIVADALIATHACRCDSCGEIAEIAVATAGPLAAWSAADGVSDVGPADSFANATVAAITAAQPPPSNLRRRTHQRVAWIGVSLTAAAALSLAVVVFPNLTAEDNGTVATSPVAAEPSEPDPVAVASVESAERWLGELATVRPAGTVLGKLNMSADLATDRIETPQRWVRETIKPFADRLRDQIPSVDFGRFAPTG